MLIYGMKYIFYLIHKNYKICSFKDRISYKNKKVENTHLNYQTMINLEQMQ